jgi:hypothetical protein
VQRTWSAPTSWEEVTKRAAGRAKYNSLRQFQAALRRRQVLTLLGEYGWSYGVPARIARQLGVSAATLSRDLARLMPLMIECPTCGQLRPRDWWAEADPGGG